ncbi:hypothetical protein RB2150_13751 [Rhodobacteraceae bacterium HTCC2150]|nr:hypothetical protein RB2150_13751 [Rhodobacteraceae bacterium HTCC2150]
MASYTYSELCTDMANINLAVLGGIQDGETPLPDGCKTLLLLGPLEPNFWTNFKETPEFGDGSNDPMNRWSQRVITVSANQYGAQAYFPFGTTPPHPFFTWATASGRCWSSPVMWLVHDEAGTMVSFRGALGFDKRIELPPLPANPCDICDDKPCLKACPVGALTGAGYDVPACHAYLDQPEGQECLDAGCQVRLACPISQSYGRAKEQSAFHMGYFHPAKGVTK